MDTILVTGATGTIGRPLVALLASAGAPVRALTRQPDAPGFPPGVEVVTTLEAGMRRASAVFLNSRALGDQLGRVAELARRMRTRRLVALSAINADDDFSCQPSRFRGDRNREVEQLVIESGAEWVSLRPSEFVSNYFGMWGPHIRAGDVVCGPFAAASSAPIIEHDVSAVAVRALLTDDLLARRIPLTGPQAFTEDRLADVMGNALGRKLTYREVPGEQITRQLVAQGFSTAFATAYLAMRASTIDSPAQIHDEVDKILGRPAQTVADAVRANRILFQVNGG